ncbi:flagellar hook-length control protein FliK [Jonesiaceae bacterium BS-20]|uniref:Flagellar hook-length control protein FliK n=1 Tax=Jonesiaceae bacterium BS-20 TaxID=3120821 RepID=A0AAU7DWP7_9MICO
MIQNLMARGPLPGQGLASNRATGRPPDAPNFEDSLSSAQTHLDRAQTEPGAQDGAQGVTDLGGGRVQDGQEHQAPPEGEPVPAFALAGSVSNSPDQPAQQPVPPELARDSAHHQGITELAGGVTPSTDQTGTNQFGADQLDTDQTGAQASAASNGVTANEMPAGPGTSRTGFGAAEVRGAAIGRAPNITGQPTGQVPAQTTAFQNLTTGELAAGQNLGAHQESDGAVPAPGGSALTPTGGDVAGSPVTGGSLAQGNLTGQDTGVLQTDPSGPRTVGAEAVGAPEPQSGVTGPRHANQTAHVNQGAPPPLAQQVRGPIGQLRTAAAGDHVFSIRITPENLGPVQVRAHIGGDGIRVELVGASDAVRDQLRTMLSDLRRDLQSTGMTAQLSVSNSDAPAHDKLPGHGFKDQPDREHNPNAQQSRADRTDLGPGALTIQADSGAPQSPNYTASGVDILA